MRVKTIRQTLSILFAIGFVLYGRWYVTNLQPRTNTIFTTSTILDCPALTLDQRVERADVIVSASVAMVVPGKKYAEVYLDPLITYKGQLVRPMRILAKSLTGYPHTSKQTFSQVRLDGKIENELSFASDQKPYLLFLHASTDGYLTSRCDGSRPIGEGLTPEEQRLLAPVDVVQ